jgi:hypothetical protein
MIMDNKTVAIDTPEGIAWYQMQVFKHRLVMEMKGYRSSINTLQAYNAKFGTEFKTRKAAHADVCARLLPLNEKVTEDPC